MYYLTAFGSVVFPLIQPITAMPTAPGMNGTLATLGGGFDAWGADTAPANFPVALSYRVTVIGATTAAYMATGNALRALGRTRAYLYRTGQDGSIQRALARCERIDALDSVETFGAIEFSFDFAVWEHWQNNWSRGGLYFETDATWDWDSGLFFDSVKLETALTAGAATTVSVTNGGNIATEDIILTIHAGDAAITVVTVAIAALGVSLTWTGTLAIGANLVIDAGAPSVLNATVDAYAGLSLASHTIVPWLRLAPGANSVVVTLTGGGTGSTINFDFADRWA